ncbi:MAG: YhbY family RNA-binding protein [Deltaproteobacteria bacterium]|nr:YhbY family RNA-binding protein [Candidatus Tharpella sp.]
MLKGFQKKHLRGLAHVYKPVVLIGQKGISESLSEALEEALDSHELIKVKFVDFKEKEQKKEMIEQLEKSATCEMVGMTGHIAIFFRQNRNPEKRKINVPKEK